MRKDDKAIIIVPNIMTIFTATFSAKKKMEWKVRPQ